MFKRSVFSAVVLSLALTPAFAQQRPGGPPGAQRPAPAEPGAPSESQQPRHEVAGPAEEKVSQTEHVVRLDGREIRYTATAGTIPIRLEDGRVAARMFFVAYTKDGEDVKTRPISFLYNGGPGSATVWLHMGSFAPKHVEMAADGFQPAPPYRLVDNEGSLIDVSDLVFVDAIDTGYSRVMPDINNSQFHGQEGDIHAFGEFVNQYPEGVQPLGLPEVPDRRELRHHPLRGAFGRSAEPPRDRAERDRPDLLAAHVSDAVAGAGQRHRLRGSD